MLFLAGIPSFKCFYPSSLICFFKRTVTIHILERQITLLGVFFRKQIRTREGWVQGVNAAAALCHPPCVISIGGHLDILDCVGILKNNSDCEICDV